MGLRWGFKSEANWYAREMRRELRLELHHPLCPWKLADHLGFRVIELTSFAQAAPKEVAYLLSPGGANEFSAITLPDQAGPFIIHNDSHHRKRQAANIAHELTHGILIHPLLPLRSNSGTRQYHRDNMVQYSEPLTLLTGEADEWVQVSEDLWQNKRCPRIFKNAEGAYDIQGRVFRRNGSAYTNINSRTPVTFPYVPKTEYVDVASNG